MPEIFHSVGKVQSFGTDLDFSFFFFLEPTVNIYSQYHKSCYPASDWLIG